MRLARTCLAIGKNGAIVPLNNLIDKLDPYWLVNLLLGGLSIKYIVKGEDFIFSFIAIDILNEELIFLKIEVEVFWEIWVRKSVLLAVYFSLKGRERTITFTVYSDMPCKSNFECYRNLFYICLFTVLYFYFYSLWIKFSSSLLLFI